MKLNSKKVFYDLPILSGDFSWASVSEASCSLTVVADAPEDGDVEEGVSISLTRGGKSSLEMENGLERESYLFN